MVWPAMLFNLCVGLLCAAFLFRAVRRYERRADAIMAKLDREEELSIQRWDVARAEIIVSMREKIDRAIAEMDVKSNIHSNGNIIEIRVTENINLTEFLAANTNSIPTETEIRALPKWAQVALLVRSVKREFPLYEKLWITGDREYIQLEKHTLSLAEQSAAFAQNRLSLQKRVSYGTVFHGMPIEVASIANHLGEVALSVMYPSPEPTQIPRLHRVLLGVQKCMQQLSDMPPSIQRDFNIIAKLSQHQEWTDDTPVPPSIFGPLWPDGSPNGWPKQEIPTTEIVFEFDIPDDMTTDYAVAFAKELSVALCSLDLAGGGHGLAIQPPLEITAPAPVPAGSLV
jgi:hypothetical protein